MSHNDDKIASACGGVMLGFIAGMACMLPWKQDFESFKKEAIDNGYAEYQTDSSGVTKFVGTRIGRNLM